MPDFFDKLFKTNLGPDDPTYAINGVAAVIFLYAEGSLTKPQASAKVQDSNGNPIPSEELADATILLSTIDAATGNNITLAFNKLQAAEKVIAVMHTVELGWIDKQTAKNFLGI